MFIITSAQLKMFSAICSNLVVVFLAAVPITLDFSVLTLNILAAMIFWKLGVLTEEKLEDLL